ncbi:hypothetical protein D5085_18540 [Ectothiorhodospiraceae bacterium BW-2]|nr:hypothetical protein D5085_18540 [Ectothiorhodospiraceae bacterium BW-2]
MGVEALLLTGYLLLYGLLHSLLASLACKQWVARRFAPWFHAYRFGFNLLALLLLLPVVWMLWQWRGEVVYQWPEPWHYLGYLLLGGAVALLLYSGRCYDMGYFSGVRQLREGERGLFEPEPFSISTLHRFVRHPWYSLLLVMLWCRPMDQIQLTATVVVTLYLLVGYRLEERKLMAAHGERYRRYRERVAALIPLPGRTLSTAEAAALLVEADSGRRGG